MKKWSVFIAAVLILSAGLDLTAESLNDSIPGSSEELVRSIIKRQYKNENIVVTVDIGNDRLELPGNCIIDVETGRGHQGYLNFFRLELNGDEGSIEKVSLQTSTILVPDPEERSQVKRAVIKRKDIDGILEAVSMLPAIKLNEESTVDTEVDTEPPVINADGSVSIKLHLSPVESGWVSSSDFFMLVRVLDENRKILMEKEYAGYYGSTDQLEYLPIAAVCEIVADRLDKIDRWNAVPSNKLRECHLSDAFSLNRNYLIEDFHWWVLEDSLEGLMGVGNISSLEAVKYILDRYEPRTDRLANKIKAIAENPDYWISGAPKDPAVIEK